MANDNGLIDEYEKIQTLKKEIEKSEEELKERIIRLAKEKGTDVLFGAHKKCSIKEYDKIVYPEDKTQFIELMKKKGHESYDLTIPVQVALNGNAVPVILGRAEFFDKFKITFDQANEIVLLKK